MDNIIEFKLKKDTLIDMWPQDWDDEFNPTMEEASNTLLTIKKYKSSLLNELSGAGVQSEFSIRNKLDSLDELHCKIMFYLGVGN